jgi:predicted ATPase/DNA-binding SARP family transcriptional activator
LRAISADRVISRFTTRQTAALLAYLAYHRERPPAARETLIDIFWPESDPDAGRQNLSRALSYLRPPLEPPGVPSGAVIVADRVTVRLNPDAVTTDVAAFDASLLEAARAAGPPAQQEALARAVALYRGPLLPTNTDDWVLREREWLAERYFQGLEKLLALLATGADWDRALEYARQGVRHDPLREEAHHALIRLLFAAGRPDAALRQYREMERILWQELGTVPEAASRALLAALEERVALGRDKADPTDRSPAGRGTTARQRRRAPLPPADPAFDVPGHVGLTTGRSDRRVNAVEPALPPAPAPLFASSGSLPPTLTRFFGREEEIAALCEMLQGQRGSEPRRLVTLAGPGGSGKSRLAIEVARRLAPTWHDAVCFVPLADISNGRLLLDTIRKAMGLPRAMETEALEQVVAALRGRPVLLILDNFEHLVEEAAPRVWALLARAPALTCLVTSRQRLNLEGEREFPVPPLPVPTNDQRPTTNVGGRPTVAPGLPTPSTPAGKLPTLVGGRWSLVECPSVQLFVDRAQAVRPDFQVTAHNAATVAALCRQLEGIPLALELAAARVRILSVPQMVAQIGTRLDWLVSRRWGAGERHRSLRAAIEWSCRLLSPELQRFFARLSVFRGGWTLEAAAAVCAEAENGRPSTTLVADTLELLQECSLVQSEEIDGGAAEPGAHREGGCEVVMRFRMLETIREFGLEMLGAEAPAILQRHAEYFAEVAEATEAGLIGQSQPYWMTSLGREHDNLLAALEWCRAHDAPSTEAWECLTHVGLRLAGALWWFWSLRGPYVIAWKRAEDLLARADGLTPTLAYAKALLGSGQQAFMLGDLAQAEARCEQALTLFHRFREPWFASVTLNVLGSVRRCQRRWTEAGALYEEGLALSRAGEYRWSMALSLMNLALCDLHHRRDAEGARRRLEESLALFREVGDQFHVALVLGHLGLAAQRLGDLDRAVAYHSQSLRGMRDMGNRWGVGVAVEGLAMVACGQGQMDRAARLFGTAEAVREGIGSRLYQTIVDDHERHVAATRAALGEEAFLVAWTEGRATPLEQALASVAEAEDPS